MGLSVLQNGEVHGAMESLLVLSPEPSSEVGLLEVKAAPWIPEYSNTDSSPAFHNQEPVPTHPRLPGVTILAPLAVHTLRPYSSRLPSTCSDGVHQSAVHFLSSPGSLFGARLHSPYPVSIYVSTSKLMD